MTIFYRYYRPCQYNPVRAEIETAPHGGICLRVESLDTGDMWFTHARCNKKELFSKKVARQIVDHRAFEQLHIRDELPHLNWTLNPTSLIIEVVSQIEQWAPPDSQVFTHYLAIEYKELVHTIKSIVAQNKLAAFKANEHQLHLAASNYKGFYANFGR